MMKYEIHMRQPNRIFLYCSERLGIFFFFALNSSHAHTHPRILNSFFFFYFFFTYLLFIQAKMAFRFNWPEFDQEFYVAAKSQLETALNKDNKPSVIVDYITVKELNMGSTV